MLLPPSTSAPSPFDAATLAADLNLTPPPLPGWSGHTPTPPPLPGSSNGAAPPPIPSRKRARPAHLLLAELEARRAEDGSPSEDLSRDMPSAEIARAKIEKPAVPKARRGPSDGVIRAVAGAVIAAGIFGVYWTTQQEPEPEVKVDAALRAEVERRREAVEALERGHALVVQGPEQADAAIEAYSRALALDPKLASAERGLGISHAAKEEDAKAVEHYRRYLELDPDAEDAREVKKIIAAYEKATAR